MQKIWTVHWQWQYIQWEKCFWKKKCNFVETLKEWLHRSNNSSEILICLKPNVMKKVSGWEPLPDFGVWIHRGVSIPAVVGSSSFFLFLFWANQPCHFMCGVLLYWIFIEPWSPKKMKNLEIKPKLLNRKILNMKLWKGFPSNNTIFLFISPKWKKSFIQSNEQISTWWEGNPWTSAEQEFSDESV